MLKYRMNRQTYWACFATFLVAVSVLAYFEKLNGGLEMAMVLIGIPRLHDIGRSGWIIAGVIAVLFLVVFGAVAAGATTDTILLTGGILFLVVATLGVWLGIIPGNPNANQWGEPPQPGVRFRKASQ